MKKLLNRSLRPLIIYALLVILLSIPVYFFIITTIWVNEMDEHHRASRTQVEKRLNDLHFDDATLLQTITLWNQLQHGIHIEPATGALPVDSTYTVTRFDTYHEDKEQFRGYSTGITVNNKPYRLTLETNLEEADEAVLAIGIVALLFFLVLMAGFILLNRYTAGKLWKPFYHTLNQLKGFDLARNKGLELETSPTVEFNELNAAIDRLIDNNLASYRQQKEFTENASHELQTPLAIIKSKLDLLLQYDTLNQEQTEAIGSIQLTLARASRIHKNLLFLAKIENQHYNLQEPVDLSELLSHHISLFQDPVASKHILLKTNLEAGITVTANRSLLEILVTNLLLNAVRHSAEHAQVEIQLHPGELTIRNTGNVALQEDRLFRRFTAASGETPSSGLGLAIVKEICTLFGWHISYAFEPGFHVFSVKWD